MRRLCKADSGPRVRQVVGQEKEIGKSPISYTSMYYDVISFSQVGYFTILKEKT